VALPSDGPAAELSLQAHIGPMRMPALETPIDGIGEPPQFDASPAQHARDRNWHAAKKWQAATSPAIWANTLPSVAGANPAA